ncbi:glyceraldehyde-3-phosphate dehydrogenase (NADP+) [Salinibacillus kushneri]|uniref:3-sulfolactaldehyde dehydrogenase n=1 Tax=Salinibacillus kushneri TaxID=237682 RepID=A0A1H9YDB0_9BACI|nr:aldehyde dehydrogenase family protein [Salinibacillus kushneri]SES66807.1 glyceraldehyde-3-phosphate dehydrogenase (NADP+) [Salinibacillus kushneri]
MKAQVQQVKMCIGGEWVNRNQKIDVLNPQNNELIASVPSASKEDMINTIEEAKKGVKIAAEIPVHKRISILNRAASLLSERKIEFAETIAKEGSKTIREAEGEVNRAIETLQISAEEARRIKGETISFDQRPGSENRVGYYYRFPIGLIAAITPFNDPLNLVAHKVGPAVASGNALIVKPASTTPLSALKLAALMEEAGLPKKVLSVITGRGSEIGDLLIENEDIRMISFTGGVETGQDITAKSGVKKLGMELGSNSPAIVLSDSDLDQAVESTISGSYAAAGQNCIGVQRIYVEEDIYEDFKTKFVERTKNYVIGDKLSPDTDMGPLITEKEALRVENWVNDAVENGAHLLCGGKRSGAFYDPTVLEQLPEHCILATEEVFGPVVILYAVSDLNEAIEKSNNVDFGLQAGIFTKNLERAFQAIHKLNVGGVMVNDSSDYRIDAMPFGGVKNSGIGREGIQFAINEMTDPKVVCFNLS